MSRPDFVRPARAIRYTSDGIRFVVPLRYRTPSCPLGTNNLHLPPSLNRFKARWPEEGRLVRRSGHIQYQHGAPPHYLLNPVLGGNSELRTGPMRAENTRGLSSRPAAAGTGEGQRSQLRAVPVGATRRATGHRTRHHFMYNESLELAAPQHTAVKMHLTS
jgi:hypothetical protein